MSPIHLIFEEKMSTKDRRPAELQKGSRVEARGLPERARVQ